MSYQNESLKGSPHDVADELLTRVQEVVLAAAGRYNSTAELHKSKTIAIETALESLREITEASAWATRMLIEVCGERRSTDRSSRRKVPSMRKCADASGVSLASVHTWVHHPAKVLQDGRRGPGTLPKSGQTSHYHSAGPGIFANQQTLDPLDMDDWA